MNSKPKPYRTAYHVSKGSRSCERCGVAFVEGEPVISRKKKRVYHEACFYAVAR